MEAKPAKTRGKKDDGPPRRIGIPGEYVKETRRKRGIVPTDDTYRGHEPSPLHTHPFTPKKENTSHRSGIPRTTRNSRQSPDPIGTRGQHLRPRRVNLHDRAGRRARRRRGRGEVTGNGGLGRLLTGPRHPRHLRHRPLLLLDRWSRRARVRVARHGLGVRAQGRACSVRSGRLRLGLVWSRRLRLRLVRQRRGRARGREERLLARLLGSPRLNHDLLAVAVWHR